MTEDTCSLDRFRKDTAEHQMEIVLDAGTHRHLRFRKPGTSCYGFDIVTWPGHLAISGDMGASVFSRLHDMFQFFRPSERWQADNPGKLSINTDYWAEKLVANDGDARRFDSDLVEPVLRDRFNDFVAELDIEELDARLKAAEPDVEGSASESVEEFFQHVLDRVRDADDLREVISTGERFRLDEWDGFGGKGDPLFEAFSPFRLTDFWESARSMEQWHFHLIWRMYAIAHAVQTYDAHHAAAAAPVAATEA